MNGLLLGEIPANRGTTICNVANTLMKALIEPGIEQRLHELEQAARKSQIKEVLYNPYEDKQIER